MAVVDRLDYRNKVILAPMVRVCTLPARLLCLRYGADIVYCEEIIDFKILAAKRVENHILNTVDYMLSDETVVFRTSAEEKGRLVFQLGTSDAKRALSAAKKIEKDVSGVDINMGCPKEFSIKGGMGAALLTQPDKVKDILTTLVQGLSIPVTCKIRMLPEFEDTLKLVKMIESTGVSAIAVHGRTKEERPRHPNRNHLIKIIAQSVKIPVIANGGSKEIHNYDDIEKFRIDTGCTSVMIARAAEWNPSIFRKEGKLPLLTVAKEYVKVALEMNNVYTNIKYCILMMMHADMDLEQGQKMLEVMSQEEISVIWELEDYFNKIKERWKQKAAELQEESDTDIEVMRQDGVTIIEMPVRFFKKDYPFGISSKQRLFEWLRRYDMPKPIYESAERPGDRYFNSVLTIGDVKYKSTSWEKSKQLAEQGAAIVASIVLDIDDGRIPDSAVQTDAMATRWKQKCKEDLVLLELTPVVSPVKKKGQKSSGMCRENFVANKSNENFDKAKRKHKSLDNDQQEVGKKLCNKSTNSDQDN